MADATAQTSIYLTPEDREVLGKLQQSTSLGRSAVIRLALHRLAEDETDMETIGRLAKIRASAEEIISLTQA